MQTFLYYLTIVAALAVLVVLALGLWTMLKGTSPSLSQRLMRLRVALQFLAIVIIMGFLYFFHA